MSLITRCPACATQFKVVPDQLKLSDGWVRCGHCSDVFDASRYLETWAPGATETRPAGVDQALPTSSRELPATPPLSAIQASVMGQGVAGSQAADDMAVSLGPEAASATLHADALDRDLTPDGPGLPAGPDQTDPIDAGASSAILPVDQDAIRRADPDATEALDAHTESQSFSVGQENPFQGGPVVDVAAPGPAASLPVSVPPLVAAASVQQIVEDVAQLPVPDQAGTTAQEPGFVRQARRRAFWRSPGVRLLLTVVVLLLSALLVTQWAVQERDRLAARHPEFQPLLVRLCEPLGCTIGAVRDLQAVVIDSSTLTRRLGDFYSFDLVLRNTSATALAVPALELSLTDTADTVISRRVYLPGELPDVPPLLPPQSTVPVSLRLSLAVGNELPMAGYRALVFYP